LGASPAESAPYSVGVGGMHVQRPRRTDKGDKESHKAIPGLDGGEEKFVHKVHSGTRRGVAGVVR
jgi:hypothetical protein